MYAATLKSPWHETLPFWSESGSVAALGSAIAGISISDLVSLVMVGGGGCISMRKEQTLTGPKNDPFQFSLHSITLSFQTFCCILVLQRAS